MVDELRAGFVASEMSKTRTCSRAKSVSGSEEGIAEVERRTVESPAQEKSREGDEGANLTEKMLARCPKDEIAQRSDTNAERTHPCQSPRSSRRRVEGM